MKRLSGLYLVLDPSQERRTLLNKLSSALKGGVGVLQIWNNWAKEMSNDDKINFIYQVKGIAKEFNVPVLMNNDWKLAIQTQIDGIHFDQLPATFDSIKEHISDKYIGLTVSNNLDLLKKAEALNLSYISFCSVFPSTSVDSCEIVDPENIEKARLLTQTPIFLSGGIKENNIDRLKGLSFDGVAVISGILDAASPKRAAENYLFQLERLKETSN